MFTIVHVVTLINGMNVPTGSCLFRWYQPWVALLWGFRVVLLDQFGPCSQCYPIGSNVQVMSH